MLKQEKIFTNPLARAIAAALALTAAQSANALVIATNTIDGSASALAGPLDTYGPVSSTGAVFDSANASNGVHQGNASSWANQFNAYAASASGEGTFTAKAHLNRKLVVTNDTGGQANTTASFYVYGGSLFNDDQGDGAGEASYALKILINGIEKFVSAALITSDGTFSRIGTELDGASQSGNDYSWSGTSLLFDLGLLDALEEVTIEYDLVVSSFGDYGVIPGDGGGFCDEETGYGCCPVATLADTFTALVSECSFDTAAGSASAFLGDPNEFNFQNQTAEEDIVVTFTRVPSTVPEPTSLLLTGLGLAGLGWRRRRHR